MPRPAYEVEPIFCMTSDVDWASEDAIQTQQTILDKYELHATYFVTHHSPLLNKWHEDGRIDLGVHPNFLPGSSHGATIDEVVDNVMQFAPGARCFRGHRYFDATPATHALVARGIIYDSNLCTNLQQDIAPIAHESGLVRFPCFWEDGTHFEWRRAWDFSQFTDIFGQAGIKVISLHPMVTAMNVTTREYWAQLKVKFPPAKWIQVTASELRQNACEEPGPRQFLVQMLHYIRHKGFKVLSLEEMYETFGKPYAKIA